MEIWGEGDRIPLKCQTRERICARLRTWVRTLPPPIQARLHRTSLYHIPFTMFTHIDAPLISTFVERWQPDTSSFNLPFGEMTIMMHDVVHILHLPVEGCLVHDTTSFGALRGLVADLIGRTIADLWSPFWDNGAISAQGVAEILSEEPPAPLERQLTGIIWLILGCCLFTDKSGSRLRPFDLVEASSPDNIHTFSWGSATLAYLYRQLGEASRTSTVGITGCLTLLQAWIYEYFPCFRPRAQHISGGGGPRAQSWTVYPEKRSHDRLCSIRRQLDTLTAEDVDWLPYGHDFDPTTISRTLYRGTIRYRGVVEPYMPDRCLRQLGRMQIVPVPVIAPESASRPSKGKYVVQSSPVYCESSWSSFPTGNCIYLELFKKGSTPSACSTDYLSWYERHSHPYLLNGGNVARSIPDRTATEQVIYLNGLNIWINVLVFHILTST
ncbi:protein MAINTENANCE OF MERISTEMS-like [Beta vulgaris subsp. vulgaris]|uniref:protein MAINTENANCE OF MERISTEMS-like n=1 Tax=Beta vulgaris subsp. vulgaris TaxID=3555 RepID=UPI002037632F|nr:protein MAINTENANCE OF MERISTEMS-like [Beta vulgaris subsp. vulgaris]